MNDKKYTDIIYIKKCSNYLVTDFYLKIVGEMFKRQNFKVKYIEKPKEIKNKNSYVVVSTPVEFIKFYFLGYRNLFFWMQGIMPEESYLKHNSLTRKLVLDIFEYISLKMSKGVLFVSEEMQCFVDKKYKLDTQGKSFIMPCFNTELNKNCFLEKDKYTTNIFCYVGSLRKWQCFDKTVEFYKKIEDKFQDCELRVYTSEQKEAEQILKKYCVKNYSVRFVDNSDIVNELAKVKYGFVLREDIDVNRVATPTKFSTYMAAGVIPIFSDCITDFNTHTRDMNYVVSVANINEIPCRLVGLGSEKIDPNVIMNEYDSFFNSYYSAEKYISDSQNWIENIIIHSGD